MSYQVLYRSYRPRKFSEVVGQDYIIKTLNNAIEKGKLAHAYLFCGPRGTGKTSVAKLFAKSINCEKGLVESCGECANCKAVLNNTHPDIIELDAASNNGVDDIREIVDKVGFAPILGKYKVYIIDEVHMLSGSAFNALLKTLEEPPSHVIFILATTDPQKVIPTVLSRCQRYNFGKVSSFEMRKRLKDVLANENVQYEEEALDIVISMADGGMRDALSILEQCLAYSLDGNLYSEDVYKIYGISTNEEKIQLILNAHEGKISDVVSKLKEMYQSGIDLKRLSLDLIEILKESIIYSDKADQRLLEHTKATDAQKILNNLPVSTILKDIDYLIDALSKNKQSQNPTSYFELAFIKMAEDKIVSIHKVIEEKIEKVEVTKEEVKKEVLEVKEDIKEEVKEEEIIEVIEEELPIIEEESILPSFEIVEEEKEEVPEEMDLEFICKILLHASKDEKINDMIIYNRLEMYHYEADKRKFYNALQGTELFASSHDAIVICVDNSVQYSKINDPILNEEIYNFLNDEFGIDKMVYAIDQNMRTEVVKMFKQNLHNPEMKDLKIEKYVRKNGPKSKEDELVELFGNIVEVKG